MQAYWLEYLDNKNNYTLDIAQSICCNFLFVRNVHKLEVRITTVGGLRMKKDGRQVQNNVKGVYEIRPKI